MSKLDDERIRVTISVEKPTMAFIDKAAKEHQMSRSGFMVYASIMYAKKMEIKKDGDVLD